MVKGQFRILVRFFIENRIQIWVNANRIRNFDSQLMLLLMVYVERIQIGGQTSVRPGARVRDVMPVPPVQYLQYTNMVLFLQFVELCASNKIKLLA